MEKMLKAIGFVVKTIMYVGVVMVTADFAEKYIFTPTINLLWPDKVQS